MQIHENQMAGALQINPNRYEYTDYLITKDLSRIERCEPEQDYKEPIRPSFLPDIPADYRMAARLYRAARGIADSIDVDLKKRGGVPVVKGTRVPVSQVVAELAEGQSISEVAQDLDLDVTSLRSFLECLSVYLSRPLGHAHRSV